jgi:hypothetical protein
MKNAILAFGLVLGLSVQASQSAKVLVDSASVLDKPQIEGTVVGTVPKDTSIQVSNVPTNGYYKSRIPSGVVGWVSGNDILTGGAPAAAVADAGAAPKRPEKKKRGSESVSDHSRILISAGLNILSNGGFPPQIPTLGSTSSLGGTFEMQFKLSDSFYWAGRAEYFTGSSTQVLTAAKTQTWAFHEIPVMGGIIYSAISKPDFRLGIGGYVGVALGTSLTITQGALAPVTYTISNLCEYLNVQGSYAISSSVSILGEAGYRLQSASFPAAASLSAAAFSANFSGIVSRLGVELRL